MCGGGGTDTIRGAASGDSLSGGSGINDTLYGQTESDKLKARDSARDYAYGGYGADYGLLDASDVTTVEYPSY